MRASNPNAPVEPISYLRRQAEFCLRTSRACSDRAAAERWELMAAEFHARSLRVEFDVAFQGGHA
jgi:hypothetical protein